ncbi:MAG: DUF4202 domain-containing protein [Spirochaetaceae bacterium]|nr:DUF4202 domain-containing protein [Spirochaetaceae bacterium]
MTADAQLREVLGRIDAANRADPHTENEGGVEHPKELLYGRRMSGWLERLRPDAAPALRIAARAQHLERWAIPRDRFPMGRTGYLRWRTTLGRHHAERTAELMRAAGFDGDSIAAVAALLRKEGLARAAPDSDVQALEDCACLVFLEHYLGPFADKHPPAKVADIVTKTWRKMSPSARNAALVIEYRSTVRTLLEAAGITSG